MKHGNSLEDMAWMQDHINAKKDLWHKQIYPLSLKNKWFCFERFNKPIIILKPQAFTPSLSTIAKKVKVLYMVRRY